MRNLPAAQRALRRSRIYRGRLFRAAANRSLDARCVFMHVPKCGGTSLSEALYALVPIHRKIGIIDTPSLRRALALQHGNVDDPLLFHDEGSHAATVARARELLLLMHLAHGCDLVHGHFLFSERAFAHFGESARFVTVLRDPVERTVSNYHQACRGGAFDGDFDAFLDSTLARRMALHVLRYFSGVADVVPADIPALTERAKANMSRFSVLGFIEDLPDFLDRFETTFGARPKVAHHNRTARAQSIALTARQKSRLERLCAPDMALTEYARTLHAPPPRPDCTVRAERKEVLPPWPSPFRSPSARSLR